MPYQWMIRLRSNGLLRWSTLIGVLCEISCHTKKGKKMEESLIKQILQEKRAIKLSNKR